METTIEIRVAEASDVVTISDSNAAMALESEDLGVDLSVEQQFRVRHQPCRARGIGGDDDGQH